jgi:hypothetical protein
VVAPAWVAASSMPAASAAAILFFISPPLVYALALYVLI